jgi:gas vesicle protein
VANEYEKEDGGPGFVMGLLTGTVLGAGLGMLFAPKPGSELRGQISEGANTVSRTASEGYRKAADAATTVAEKGREFYDRARDAVARGSEEVKRYTGSEPESRTSESRESRPGMPNPPISSSGRGGGM